MKKILIIIFLVLFTTGCNDSLKGKWEASIKDQKVYDFNSNGETKGGKEKYILDCDGKGHYDLKENSNDLANASYSISNNKVTFYDEGGKELAICKLIDNKILDCSELSYYSVKYTKIED